MQTNVALLTGFDRSGTSAISKAIATHPQVELLWRVFNSGSIRRKMNVLLTDESASDEDRHFFSELEHGRLYTDYIETVYHWKTSTTTEGLVEGRLHVLITNINHLAVPWSMAKYPKIGHWGIWRDPYHILQSCVENKFLEDWYEGAVLELAELVTSHPFLKERFAWALSTLDSVTRKTAFILAVRNYVLFNAVGAENLLDYDLFCETPDRALFPLLNRYGIANDHDFDKVLDVDLNTIPGVVPYERGRVKTLYFSDRDMSFLADLFAPLFSAARRNNDHA